MEKAALFSGGVCSPQPSLAVERSGELGRYRHSQRQIMWLYLHTLVFPYWVCLCFSSFHSLSSSFGCCSSSCCLASSNCWALWASTSDILSSCSCSSVALFSVTSWRASWTREPRSSSAMDFSSFLGARSSWKMMTLSWSRLLLLLVVSVLPPAGASESVPSQHLFCLFPSRKAQSAFPLHVLLWQGNGVNMRLRKCLERGHRPFL